MEPARFGARLPAARTPLIGRDDTLASLRPLVLHADERLLTLPGVGGCGKTRLALHLAADLAPAFHRRIWLVDLAPITDAALVPIAWTASRSPSNWRRHAPASSLSRRSSTVSTTPSVSWPAATVWGRPASRRYAPPSTGVTRC